MFFETYHPTKQAFFLSAQIYNNFRTTFDAFFFRKKAMPPYDAPHDSSQKKAPDVQLSHQKWKIVKIGSFPMYMGVLKKIRTTPGNGSESMEWSFHMFIHMFLFYQNVKWCMENWPRPPFGFLTIGVVHPNAKGRWWNHLLQHVILIQKKPDKTWTSKSKNKNVIPSKKASFINSP